MVRVIARRLLISILLLFVVSFVTFFIQSLLPGDPALSVLGTSATPEQISEFRDELHLDEPLLVQYGYYLAGVFSGDFGRSLYSGEPVLKLLAQRVPVSISLILGGTTLATAVGVTLGVLSATGGRMVRRTTDVGSLVGGALPDFWVALVLASIFGVALGWFPVTGYTPFTQSPAEWGRGLVLPVITLALGAIGLIAKVVRDSMLTTMSMDYIRTLRAAGVTERTLIWKYALKNSSMSLLTVIGIVFVGALSGSVLVENVFVLPGLGSLAASATSGHDILVLQGIAVTFTLIVVVVNLVVDISYGLLNPKVRTS